MAQPTEAAQPTEMSEHQAASVISQIPQLTLDMPPHIPLASDSEITHLPRQLVSNYNNIEADEQKGKTEIQDIISSAYSAECFKSGVAFPRLLVLL